MSDVNGSAVPMPVGAVPAPVKMASPVNWWKLDATERVETLAIVSTFATELVQRYGIRTSMIPPCWFKHDALVQELLAMFQYRNQQQYIDVAPPGAPHEWHYQFQSAMHRLLFWTAITGCTDTRHVATTIPAWAVPGMEQRDNYLGELESHSVTILSNEGSEEEELNIADDHGVGGAAMG